MLDRRDFLRLTLLSSAALAVGCQKGTAPTSIATAGPTPLAARPEMSPIPKGFEFIVRNRRPKNLETPVEAFGTYLTPNEKFFVRSHHSEPNLKDEDWKLTITGGATETEINLADLKKFEAQTVTAVLQCAGNSRSLYRPRVPGVQWEKGAVGNAEWRGVRLSEVLKQAGVTKDSPEHVVFQGADKPLMKTVPVFARQLSLEKSLHPDTMLAYEMNGEPLPRFHGGPVRLVVPGWVGDDWIKWITSIKLQKEPFDGFFYKTGYRFPTKFGKPGEAVDPSLMKPMKELVTRSLFSSPSNGNSLKMVDTTLRGVAWTGGDALIDKVEVSDDGGATWVAASFETEAVPYAWRLWSLPWKPKKVGAQQLLCRASDSRGRMQPIEPSPWNHGGYLWGSADSIDVEVVVEEVRVLFPLGPHGTNRECPRPSAMA